MVAEQQNIAWAAALKELAYAAGFELAGIAPVLPSAHPDAYRAWIAAGKHGQMDYLARNIDERLDLHRKLPWARSVLCVGLAYWRDAAPPAAGSGKIARYAWGRDYHKVFDAKLKRIEQRFRSLLADSGIALQARAYCDTGPILERELAMNAGLGWVGKHTLLIHPRHGSFFALGELVLSVDLPPDTPGEDHCGTCRRCIDACPTAAITPYSVDAVKCLSYQTIENRGEIPAALQPALAGAGYLVGCDICQDVCPFNRRPLPTSEPDFSAHWSSGSMAFSRDAAAGLPLAEVAAWSDAEWDQQTRGRAFRRIKLPMFQRNAALLADAARQ